MNHHPEFIGLVDFKNLLILSFFYTIGNFFK